MSPRCLHVTGLKIAHHAVCALFVISVLTGCSLTSPTLRVRFVSGVPRPNGLVEATLWGQAPELRLNLSPTSMQGGPGRPVKLRAIHDGRAISFLISWPDSTDSVDQRTWLWNADKQAYHLEQSQVDKVSLQWRLTPSTPWCMLEGRAGLYDIWRWQGGWTDLSGYADDLCLKTTPHDERPEQLKAPLYPAQDGQGWVEFTWTPDPGVPGTVPTQYPLVRGKRELPGAQCTPYPGGSAADVQACGLYSKLKLRRAAQLDDYKGELAPGYWVYEEWPERDAGFWFVEFHRLLDTGHPEEDYTLTGPGPHWFQVAVHDNATGSEHYISRPIRLKLDPVR